MLKEADVLRSVARWQKALGLHNWRIKFEPGPSDHDNVSATLRHSWDYDDGTLRLDEGWQLWEPTKLDENVVHELLHAVMRDVEHSVTKVIEADGPGKAAYDHAVEGAIDRLARAFVALT